MAGQEASTTADGHVHHKKSRRASSSSDDKKPRGRPRVEPQDETAADRRRTQIRLAQRAYRLRKETTIASLKQRTAELTDVINDMHAAMLAFKTKASKTGLAGLSASIFADLSDTEKVFDSLKERAADGPDDGPDCSEKLLRAGSDEHSPEPDSLATNATPTKKRKASSAVDVPSKQQATSAVPSDHDAQPAWSFPATAQSNAAVASPSSSLSSASTSSQHSAATPNTVVTEPTDDDLQWPGMLADAVHVNDASCVLSETDLTVADPFSISDLFAQPGLLAGLSSPASLAWQEPCFSRQLHRATLEAGVLLIQRQVLNPHRFNRKFQLCLPFGRQDVILSKIKNTLLRDGTESLDWDDHPMRHLGGCGLHYPPADRLGQDSPQDADRQHVAAHLGPDTLVDVMNSMDEQNGCGQTINLAGFEGEWFDAQDVQGYLEHKGLHIEPGSSVATYSPATSKPLQRPASPISPLDGLDIAALEKATARRKSKSNKSAAASRSSQGAGWTAQQATGYSDQQKQAFADVSVLLQELIKHAKCLGRTPGYRRRDVDRAIKMSLSAAC